MRLSFYKINSEYCDFLRRYDSKVPYMANDKQTRPFVGVVIEVAGKKYYAPLSSPKPKHLTMNNQIDLMRINDGKWGVINFNNMIPVHDHDIEKIDMRPNQNDTRETINYKNLLQNQLSWCNSNRDKLIAKAEKLHKFIVTGKAVPQLKTRCCDFKLLEDKYVEYELAYRENKKQKENTFSLRDKLEEKKAECGRINAERAAGHPEPAKKDRDR